MPSPFSRRRLKCPAAPNNWEVGMETSLTNWQQRVWAIKSQRGNPNFAGASQQCSFAPSSESLWALGEWLLLLKSPLSTCRALLTLDKPPDPPKTCHRPRELCCQNFCARSPEKMVKGEVIGLGVRGGYFCQVVRG